MATVRDIIQLDVMKSLKLIAGKGGLEKKVTRVGILDFEFTRSGSAYDVGWKDEFVLTSFLYAVDKPDSILRGIKKLYNNKASALAIRNVFQFEISSEIIRFANQHDFPIFVMDDYQLYFEDVITAFHDLEERFKHNDYQEKKLIEILHGNMDEAMVKMSVLDINRFLGNTYYVYYIKPANRSGTYNLKNLLIRGLDRQYIERGDTLIRYKNGAYFIHSQNQSKGQSNLREYWSDTLQLKASGFYVGISELQPFLHTIRTALQQSLYACYYAEIYGKNETFFRDIGVYQLLFNLKDSQWQDGYFDTIVHLILEYDQKTNSELWRTLLSYEAYNGNIKKVAADMYTHENTVRYRIKKVYAIFEKDVNDLNFQTELMIAVKLYRIQDLLGDTFKLLES